MSCLGLGSVRARGVAAAACLLTSACGEHKSLPAGTETDTAGSVSAGDGGTSPRPSPSNDGGTVSVPAKGHDSGTVPTVDIATSAASFPLHISPNRRFLVDQAGQPFLINQAASWGLMQSLSTADATAWLDGLVERGFNTILASAISNDKRMPGDPPAWQGIAPFLQEWDFSQPNPAYFAHVDDILALAESRHMLVNMVVCYLGFPGDNTQGWEDELQSPQNSVEKSREYGRFLGDRYKNAKNLVWVAGGDNYPDHGSEVEKHMLAIVDGIRERDPDHLWTAHWSGMDDGMLASDNPAFSAVMDLNGYYAFNYDLTYVKDLAAYAEQPVKPLFHLDMSYETEDGGSPEKIRERAYRAMLSGGAGSSFNAGPNWYLFRDWHAMDTVGTQETTHWARFFLSRPWQDLVPDTDHTAVTDGYGTLGTSDYVSVAHSDDWEWVVAYLPRGGSVTVNLGMMAGVTGRAYWYDPTTGAARDAGEGTFPLADSQQFHAPSASSWVLVVEDSTAPWGTPGEVPSVAR